MLENVVKDTIGQEVSGAKAFELYDTFGFPKDLTALILKEKGMSYNEAEFDSELQKQKQDLVPLLKLQLTTGQFWSKEILKLS